MLRKRYVVGKTLLIGSLLSIMTLYNLTRHISANNVFTGLFFRALIHPCVDDIDQKIRDHATTVPF